MSDFAVEVDDDRAALFEEVFGSRIVPIRSPHTVRGILPGDEVRDVYLLDMNDLHLSQVRRLLNYLAGKFGKPEAEIAAEIREQGMPIVADGCTLMARNPVRFA